MKRVAIVARLRPGARERAREIISQGPPFDLAWWGLERHSVFVSETEVVFVFEGDEVEWRLDDLFGSFFSAGLQHVFGQWRELVDGEPQIAEQTYFWEGSSP